AGVGGFRQRMKCPAERARSSIECAYLSRCHAHPAVVCDIGTDDDQVAIYGRRRSDAVLSRIVWLPSKPTGEIDLPAGAESGAEAPVASIETNESRIDRRDVDEIVSHCQSTTGEVAVVGIAANFQIDAPDLSSSFSVEGDHQTAR